MSEANEQSRLYRARRHGLSHGRASRRRAATTTSTVFNRTRSQGRGLGRHASAGNAPRPPPRRRDGAEFVFTCVGNDDDLREVTLGPDGAFAALGPGAVFVDHTTASAKIARELHAAAKARGAGALDAPVSGGQSGAENGTLTVMVGGDEGGFPQSRARDRGLCAGGQSDRPVGLWPAHQDGQPDLHRRPDRRPRRGASFRHARRPRHREGHRHDLQGRGPVLADGQSLAAPWSTASSISASPSIGCARISRFASTRRGANGAELPVTALVDQFYAEIQAMGGGAGTPRA